jgi:hypothetical protein
VAFVRGAAAPAAATTAAANATAASSGSPERVTLFQVPLMCPAVKGLGCGGKARPYMAQLEQNAKVAEAWLNHPGTVLAVVWKDPQQRSAGAALVASVFQPGSLTVTPLDGAPLNEALQDFAARSRWYRNQDVNKLSTQEGLVFRDRMAKRVETRTKLSAESSAALRADLQKFCIEWLLGQGGRDTKVLLELGAKYLNAEQLKVYEQALKEGFQAQAGEPL